jgi:hypothetical protein
MYFKKTKDFEKLSEMHLRAFPNEDVREFKRDVCWFILNESKEVIGYCSLNACEKDTVFFSSSAVFEKGKGRHKASISYRCRWAKRHGYKWVVTYVHPENYPSLVNLINSKFELYIPDYKYVGDGFTYMRKKLRD